MLGLAVVAAAGCHKAVRQLARPPVVPDAAALHTARVGEIALIASYDAALAGAPIRKRPALQVARAIHATHLSALGGALPAKFSAIDAGHDAGILHSSAAELRGLALAATAGSNAALLASIAASHEVSAGG